MAAAFCDADIAVVIDGEENVCYFGEVGEGGADGAHIRVFHEEERHARSQQDDAGLGVSGEGLALEVFLPESDVVVG